jgi:hypothetical protein
VLGLARACSDVPAHSFACHPMLDFQTNLLSIQYLRVNYGRLARNHLKAQAVTGSHGQSRAVTRKKAIVSNLRKLNSHLAIIMTNENVIPATAVGYHITSHLQQSYWYQINI